MSIGSIIAICAGVFVAIGFVVYNLLKNKKE